MIFIGDLYQLSPVVSSSDREIFKTLYKTPYFYSAHVFDAFEMEFVELQKVYRQHDQKFIDLLNSVRNNTIGEKGLELLRQRVNPDFAPAAGQFLRLPDDDERDGRNHQRRAVVETGDAGAVFFPGKSKGNSAEKICPLQST